jgi:hypothetical protein
MKIRLTWPKKPEKDRADVAKNAKDTNKTPTDHGAAQATSKQKTAVPKPKPHTSIEVDDPKDVNYAPPKHPRKLSESSVEEIKLDASGKEVVPDLPAVRASVHRGILSDCVYNVAREKAPSHHSRDKQR